MAACQRLACLDKPHRAFVVMADRVKPSAWAGYMRIPTSGNGRINLHMLLWRNHE